MRPLERVCSLFIGVRRPGPASAVRLLICLLLIGSLIKSTLPSIRGGLAGPGPHSANPYYSSDSYLQMITGAPNSSERLIRVVASLPKDKPLLVFERDHDSVGSFLAMTLAYLSWPNDVRFEVVHGNACDRELGAVAPDSVAAVAFCDLPAPTWIQGGIRLGTSMRLLAPKLPNDPSR